MMLTPSVRPQQPHAGGLELRILNAGFRHDVHPPSCPVIHALCGCGVVLEVPRESPQLQTQI